MKAERITPEQIASFSASGYVILRGLIEASLMEVLERYVYMQRFNKHYLDDVETRSRWRYADVFGESMMAQLQPMMEKLTGYSLYPTNSVLRIYQTGGSLKKHVDRATCEFSVSLTVGYESRELYPIWIRSGEVDVPIRLDRGDMLIYRGCELLHWRESFAGRSWAQLFLHYVNAQGNNARYKYDGRLALGMDRGHVLTEKQVE